MNKCAKCGNNRQYKVSNICDNCIINALNNIECCEVLKNEL